MVSTMREAGLSLRDAAAYSGSSWNLLYHQPKPRFVAPDALIVEKVKRLILERPSYGTRRIAAQLLSRELSICRSTGSECRGSSACSGTPSRRRPRAR